MEREGQFYSAFGAGEDDRRVSAVDADGIASAVIRELHKIIGEQDAERNSRERHHSQVLMAMPRKERNTSEYIYRHIFKALM